VPKQALERGKDKLGSISKQGDRYLRSLFTAGTLAAFLGPGRCNPSGLLVPSDTAWFC
jgi:hypothetical protein